jgi:O-antigen/teichoic acid export membrane protein
VKQQSQSDMLLSSKVAKGGFWLLILRMSDNAIGLLKLFIIARLLAPNDFGMLGIAFLIIATLDTFSQTGLDTALIQMKDDIKEYLNTVWSISIIRGFILYGILFMSAPYVAVFFKSPESVTIIRVVGITIILRSFTNIGIIYFQKELKFNKHFICRFSSTLANFIVSIIAVFMLKSVWALVFGQLADCITGVIASYLLHQYRPRFNLNLEKVKKLFGFGKWVLSSSILIFLFTQGDDFFVGGLLGATALGFYQMAYRISSMPTTEISHIISKVTFPAYSKIQDNLPRLRDAYLKVLKLTTFLSFPIAGLIISLAPDFTIVILGEKWMPMVPAMQVLVLYGLIRSVAATAGPIFYSIGKPGIDTKNQFLQVILLMALIYPLTSKWGLLGTSLAVVLTSLTVNIIALIKLLRITQCMLWSVVRVLLFPGISVFIAFFSMIVIKENYFPSRGIVALISSVIYGILVYLSICYFFDKFFRYQIVSTVKDSLVSLSK